MVFSGLLFTFLFLPIVIILYYLAKEQYRNYILLIASLLFYSYGEPLFVFVMFASIVINYFLALAITYYREDTKIINSKFFLTISIVTNIGILFVFKYLDFAVSICNDIFHTSIAAMNIPLPIGISFFTFQALSYVIDVYRGTVKVQKNPLFFALYISFFPQLIAGPIVRYSTIEEQITNRKCTVEGFANGAKRFMTGYAKKVILANNLAVVAKEVFAMDIKSTNPLILWIGSICFSLQILYDFSGYSDMAIGLGHIFGFEFLENFDYPYISKSVTEFWRRWHMSLGQWFRDYVYIPLGGSRVSAGRHVVNMLIVWLLTGIWHGANYTFLLWGLEYFILLVIEKYVVKPDAHKNMVFKGIWQCFTLLSIDFGWVMFNSSNWRDGIRYCLAMFGKYGVHFTFNDIVLKYCREYGFFIIMGLLFATPITRILEVKVSNLKNGQIMNILVPVVYGIVFLWAVSFIILGAHNPFIYFNF